MTLDLCQSLCEWIGQATHLQRLVIKYVWLYKDTARMLRFAIKSRKVPIKEVDLSECYYVSNAIKDVTQQFLESQMDRSKANYWHNKRIKQ